MRNPLHDPVRWARPKILETQALIAGELADVEARQGPEGVRAYLEHAVAALEANLDPEAQMRRFLFVVTLLAQSERHGWLTPSEHGRLVELGEAILRTQGIVPVTSKLAWLYGDLRMAASQMRRREGRAFLAAWQAQMAQVLGPGEPREAGHPALATGVRAQRQGNLPHALEAFSVAETLGLAPAGRERARLGRVQALRLSGRVAEADLLAADTASWTGLTEEARLELQWEGFCRQAQLTGDLNPLINAIQRGRSHRHATYMLEATLWAKAVSSRQWLERAPKAETIRKLFPETLKKPAPNAFFYECALQLDRCYDNGIPLHVRLNDLGELLENARKLATLDKEMLVWAAAARWLVRYHQPQLAQVALGEYQALCFRATDGERADALGVLQDLDVKAWMRAGDAAKTAVGKERVARDLKTSKLARTADVTKLAMSVGGVMLKSRIKKLTASAGDFERLDAEEKERIVDLVVATLGKLKGPAVKLAQVMSLVAPNLPERVRDALAQLRDNAPPLAASVIRAQIKAELGKPVEELFATFSDEPLSSASIGQIHHATLLDGREVAVKVQYPGIKEVIDADFGLLRPMRPLLAWLFPRANVDEIITVSCQHVLAECEYLQEAAFQEEAARLAADDPDLVVPRVVFELTSPRVLTMEYVRGQRWADWIVAAPQDERDKVARTIYRTAYTGFLRHGFFNGDPHPGNYLILPGGRVACLDFGYSQHVAPARRAMWQTVFRAVLDDDFKTFKALTDKMEYVAPDAPFDYEAAWRMVREAFKYVRADGPVRFERGQVLRNVEQATYGSANRKAVRLPMDDVMFFRFAWCMQGLLAESGAEVHWGAILRGLLDDPGAPERLRVNAS